MIELLEHMNGVHSKKSIPIDNPECIICPFCNLKCGDTFVESDNLRVHIQTEHTKAPSSEPFPCERCGLVLVSV